MAATCNESALLDIQLCEIYNLCSVYVVYYPTIVRIIPLSARDYVLL
jgi:hypothetical protein